MIRCKLPCFVILYFRKSTCVQYEYMQRSQLKASVPGGIINSPLCYVQHSQRAEQSKARLSIHRLSLSVLEPAAEPQLQLEGMLLKLNSGSRKHSRQRQQPNKRVTLGGMARIVCVRVLCAFVCEGGELAAISPAGLTSDTRHLQIFCQKKGGLQLRQKWP